jgi:uncharacterized integral membrane protein (TIGR00698 family)
VSQSDKTPLFVADLYGELQLAEPQKQTPLVSYLPGLVLVGVVALAATWLSEHYGPPAILMGLLLGLALNFVNSHKSLSSGLNFSSQTLLRIGIVLIGLRITLNEISDLGLTPFLALIGIMAAVIGSGLLAAKLFKQDILFGLVAGGATAICGVSAALAIWGIVGEERVDQARFTIVLLGTTLASAFAMTFYPSIAGFLQLSDQQAGFLIGASIHDVAQAIGGGFSYSAHAGEVATVVKLSRVTLLAPILIVVSLTLQGSTDGQAASAQKTITLKQVLPWFILGFLGLVLCNTFLPLPAPLTQIAGKITSALLLCAVIAAAIKSNMAGLLAHGLRSFGPVIVTTLTAFALALMATKVLL